ncbi:Pycsar system effector family protein [Streptomyces sp. NPDC052095]|uniref:Pycsar system effector family protein n=1 Tax=unclassified Streptomyces TaxID=2593676 RepID=UPI00344D8903
MSGTVSTPPRTHSAPTPDRRPLRSVLLAFDGAVLAGLASIAGKPLPLPAQIVGATAALTLVAAAVLLLLVVCPNIGGRRRTVREGFPHWAQLSEDDLVAAMSQDTRPIRVQALSRLTVAKCTRLARAVDLIQAALGLLLVAAALTVAG